MVTVEELLHKADTFLHSSPVDTGDEWAAYSVITDLRNRIEHENARVTQSRLFTNYVIDLFSFSGERKSKKREELFKYNEQLIQKALDVTHGVPADVSLRTESHSLIREMCNFLSKQTLRVAMINDKLYLVSLYSDRRPLTAYEEIMYLFFDVIPRKW
jgi:hypothetical protein